MFNSLPKKSIKILTDMEEDNAVLNFDSISDCLVNVVKGSYPRFSIGIYGEWGTGKTSLMTIIKKKLNDNAFRWNHVPGKDTVILIEFLFTNLSFKWVKEKDVTIQKTPSNDGIVIMSNTPDKSLYLKLEQKEIKVIRDDTIEYTFITEGEKDNLNVILSDVKNNNILTVWFNAWRYEREENIAITALLKTIAFAMEKHPIYKDIKPVIIRSLKIITKGTISEILSKIISRETVDQVRKDLEEKAFPYLDLLSEIEKDTIYFDGIQKIQDDVKKILDNPDYIGSRIVVFIDDLDRCSPKRALEVFESIKVFMDMTGFIFIVGLSHDTISKLIELEYKDSEVKGKEYIKKIIQIPIILPEWMNMDIGDVIDNILNNNKLESPYHDIVRDNKVLLVTLMEPNPREVKRFINSFIISYELFNNPEINIQNLLIIQSLRFRWNEFFMLFTSDSIYKKIIETLIRYLPHYYDLISMLELDSGEFDKWHQIISKPLLEPLLENRNKLEEYINTHMHPLDKSLIKRPFPKDIPLPLKTNDDDNYTLVSLRTNLQYYDDEIKKIKVDDLVLLHQSRTSYRHLLSKIELSLWEFLQISVVKTIFTIGDWELYKRITNFARDISN